MKFVIGLIFEAVACIASAPADWIFTSARLRAAAGDQLAIARVSPAQDDPAK